MVCRTIVGHCIELGSVFVPKAARHQQSSESGKWTGQFAARLSALTGMNSPVGGQTFLRAIVVIECPLPAM
jgi:hypothetical protein